MFSKKKILQGTKQMVIGWGNIWRICRVVGELATPTGDTSVCPGNGLPRRSSRGDGLEFVCVYLHEVSVEKMRITVASVSSQRDIGG